MSGIIVFSTVANVLVCNECDQETVKVRDGKTNYTKGKTSKCYSQQHYGSRGRKKNSEKADWSIFFFF